MFHQRLMVRLLVAGAAAILATMPIGSSGAVPTQTTPTTRPTSTPASGPTGSATSIVESWALTPMGNPALAAGDRPDLSYEVAPGAQIKDAVTLYNLSNVQLTFQVYPTDARNTEDGGFDLLPRVAKATDVGSWVSLPQPNITLPAHKQATIPITIDVPATATPGDHVGGIVASSTTAGPGPDGKTVLLDRRTGPRLYLRVAGPLSPRLTVERLKITYHPSLNPFAGSADVTYRVANRGNVRLQGRDRNSVSGIFGLFGHAKPTAALPEILPGQSIAEHAKYTGIAATLVSFGRVWLSPAAIGGGTAAASRSFRAFTLALPFTVLVLLVSAWLLTRARRAYLRRNRPHGAGNRAPGATAGT